MFRIPLLAVVLILLSSTQVPAAEVDPTLLAGMKARSIGPAGMSGRIGAIEAVAGDPNIIYVGAATGGLWKSMDGGLTWDPIFDDQPVNSIGSIAIHPLYPDVVWVGTGESNLRNSISVGNGIYKSLDAGRTWTHLGLPDSERIHRILLHPIDPKIAYLAVTGKMWGDSEERGVYKTTDGGKTWERMLYVDERTGCADLAMDPQNPDKLLAAMYSHRRSPWFYESGGPGSGLFMTLDGGTTWKQITEEDGLPSGQLGRIGVAIAPSDPRIAYAFVEAKKNVFMRSEDGGFTWKDTEAKRSFGNRPFYYADIRVDPMDPNRVYSLWTFVSASIDGGKSFEVIIPWAALHPDHHAMWINPNDPQHIIEGNDGGVGVSRDHGKTWRFVSNLPIAQYYHIAVDMDLPYHIYGGMQDNGSWRGPSSVWENAGIRNHHWEEVGFGDGFDTRPYPGDSMQGYAMSQQGWVQRWNLRTGERRSIRPAPDPGDTLRFNWNAAIAQDPFDDDTIYFGSQYIHRSTDRGDAWARISDDLTTDNPEWQKQAESGGLTPDVTGAENFTSIVAIAPSPLERGVVWVGTDDGRVHITRDGGDTWTSLESRVQGVPENTWVPHIAPSPHDPGTAFVVFDNHRRSDITPYVYRTTDYGDSWISLGTEDISGYCLVIEQDPVNPDLLFLGTEYGLFVSLNGGQKWAKWTHGVPTASVMDLVVHPREHDLVLGTHGRSAFVLDDIRPLRTVSADILEKPIHLFDIPPAQQYRVRQTGASRFPGATEFRGQNKPYGAMITFSLHDEDLPHPDDEIERERKARKREAARAKGEEPKDKEKAKKKGEGGKKGKSKKPQIEVRILDESGRKIREFERPAHQGVNRIFWNLRADAFKSPPRIPGSFRSSGSGPEVLPGKYTAVLEYKDTEIEGAIEVLPDPRFDIPTADREAAWAAIQRAGTLQETITEAVQRIIDTQADIEFVLAKIKQVERDQEDVENEPEYDEEGEGDETPLAALKKEAGELKKGLGKLDKQLRRQSDAKGIPGGTYALRELSRAESIIGSTWDRPSPAAMEYLDRAERFFEQVLVDYNKHFDEDVARFRQNVEAANLELLPTRGPLTIEKE